MMKNFFRNTRLRRSTIVVGVLALSVIAASAAHATVREVGATSNFTSPACQDTSCVVLTRVTAFQLKVGTRNNVSRIPRDGSMVAFTLSLSSVVAKYTTYFNTTYGGSPTVRMSILRRAPRKGVTKYRYKLVAQTKKFNVKHYLGGNPTFALPAPVAVKRGDMLAVTTDTWLPFMVVRTEDATSTWRASRPKDKCTSKGDDFTNLVTPRMHEKVDQIKQYNCGFVGGRLLYHATFVDTPKKTS